MDATANMVQPPTVEERLKDLELRYQKLERVLTKLIGHLEQHKHVDGSVVIPMEKI